MGVVLLLLVVLVVVAAPKGQANLPPLLQQ